MSDVRNEERQTLTNDMAHLSNKGQHIIQEFAYGT